MKTTIAKKLNKSEKARIASLVEELKADGYTFCDDLNGCFYYRDGNGNIGIGPQEGEMESIIWEG